MYPDPDSVIEVPIGPIEGEIRKLDCTMNCAVVVPPLVLVNVST
jgi:hypothetical protein